MESFQTGGKIGLYPPINDALGQYPPLYATARIPDVITYIDIAYKGHEPQGKNGIIRYHDADPRVSNTHMHRKREPQQQNEVSPPGWHGTVAAMRIKHGGEIDNPYALSWWMKKKGEKSHYKDTKTSKVKKVPPKKKGGKKKKHKSFKEWLVDTGRDWIMEE